MKASAERKKLMWLGGLGGIALIVLYINVFSGPSYDNAPSARPAAGAASASGLAIPSSPRAGSRRSQTAVRTNLGTFHPRVGPARPEERPNLAGIDPTLRLDLLAKVQQVSPAGGARNLFQFSTAPAAAATAAAAKLAKEPKIAINQLPVGPVVPPGPPKPPPPPTITLKYYGYSTVRGGDGKKRAFFLDGDDIIVAGENDLIKKRYKIVKIGVNSVDVEDTQYQDVQKLPLQEESLG